MAKMSDKKAGKVKTKVKMSARGKAKALAAAAARAHAQEVILTAAVRQPGVERRKNHPTRSKDGHMQILLTRAVPHLGQAGDLVRVKPGFARNYLLPQG